MVSGLGPTPNLKYACKFADDFKPAVGGESSSAAKSVVTTATKTRAAAANMISTSSSSGSGNVYYTPAQRIHMKPRGISSRLAAILAQPARGQRRHYQMDQFWTRPTLATTTSVQQQESLGAQIGQALGALGGLAVAGANAYKTLNEAGAVKSKPSNTTNSSRIDNALNGLSNPTATTVPSASSEVQGYINSMSSCTDATSLSNAITVAEGQVSAMESATSIYQNAVNEAETKATELNTEASTLKQAVADADSQVSTAQQSVKGAEQGRNQAQEALKNIDKDYGQAVEDYNAAHDSHVNAKNTTERAKSKSDEAGQKYNTAKTATQSAKTSYNSVKSAYNSCPETITNNNGIQIPNPKKAQLKAQLAVEEQKLRQAEQDESNAKIAKQQADNDLKEAKEHEKAEEKAENNALQNKNDKYKNLGNKKAEVDKQEAVVKQKQTQLDKQKEVLVTKQKASDTANANLKDIKTKIEGNNSIKELKTQHDSSLQNLRNAINSEKERLSSLNNGKKEPAKSEPDNKTYTAPDLKEVTVNGSGMKKLKDCKTVDDFKAKYEYAKSMNDEYSMEMILDSAQKANIDEKQITG